MKVLHKNIDEEAAKTLAMIDNNYILVDNEPYDIINNNIDLIHNTTVYEYVDYIRQWEYTSTSTKITVTNETSLEAVKRLYKEDISDLMVLNFAAAREPGGGFLTGSQTQEEEICRCSNLYMSLTTDIAEIYYNNNQKSEDMTYTDTAIYSPNVLIFKTATQQPHIKPIFVNIITCPAPNNREPDKISFVNNQRIFQIWVQRWKHVLQVAAINNNKRLILGAWGCGAFRNDPKLVAEAFNKAIKSLPKLFTEICFAIPEGFSEQSKYNAEVFKNTIIKTL